MIAWLVELISQFYGLIVQFGNDVRLIFFLFFCWIAFLYTLNKMLPASLKTWAV